MPSRVLAFDVNETLLDVAALDPVFERVLGERSLRPAWFAQMLQLSFVGAITGRYTDFPSAQRASLTMLAARNGVRLSDGDVALVVDGMRTLPPHHDVVPALQSLAGAGFTMVALTNSPLPTAVAQMENAGLTDLFRHILSADQVSALKPAAAPYHLAARSAGVGVGDVRMVAAHAWDVSGALAAGCAGAFVARGGIVPSPLGPAPDIVEPDLAATARRIIEVDG